MTWPYAHPIGGSCMPECPQYSWCHCGCGRQTHLGRTGTGAHNDGYWVAGRYSVFSKGHHPRQRANLTPGPKPGVPAIKVEPLLRWLIDRYGSQRRAAEVLGWYGKSKVSARLHQQTVRTSTAERIVEVVLAHRRPQDPWSSYQSVRLGLIREREPRPAPACGDPALEIRAEIGGSAALAAERGRSDGV